MPFFASFATVSEMVPPSHSPLELSCCHRISPVQCWKYITRLPSGAANKSDVKDWEANAIPDPLKAPVVEKNRGFIAPPIR